MAQNRRALRRAGEVDPQGLKSPLGLVEVAPLNQHVDEDGRRPIAQQRRSQRAGGVEQGPCIRLGCGEISAPDGKPGPLRQHRRKDLPIGRGLGFGHGGVGQGLGCVVALSQKQRDHGTRVPKRTAG